MMIYYEKLKLAHELAKKIQAGNSVDFVLTSNLFLNATGSRSRFSFKSSALNSSWVDCEDIDDLVSKLQELTKSSKQEKSQLKPKYKVGDEVFYVFHKAYITLKPDISFGKIEHVRPFMEQEGFYCIVRGHAIDELDLYPSKAALIEAQYKYWYNQLDHAGLIEPVKCQHNLHATRDKFLFKAKTEKLEAVA